MVDKLEEIRQRWAPVGYAGLFVCPEHEQEIVVGPHDPEDRWADLGIIVFVAEAADKPTIAAFAKAPDDVRFLLEELGRAQRAFLDASRFIPTDQTIALNADTNRLAVELMALRRTP